MHRLAGIVIAILVAALCAALATVSYAQEKPSVGWALDVTNSDILKQIDAGVVKDLSMEVRDGALRLIRDPKKHTGPVSFNINFPESFDLKNFPILEVKWDSEASKVVAPELSATVRPEELPYVFDLKIESYVEPDQKGGRLGWCDYWGQYQSIYDPSDARLVLRLMPDAGFADARSASKLKRLGMHFNVTSTGSGPCEIRITKMILRSFSAREKKLLDARAAHLRDYKAPPVPKRLRSTFFFGGGGQAEFVGGYAGLYDEFARAHLNAHTLGGNAYSTDIPYKARMAEPRGIMTLEHTCQGYPPEGTGGFNGESPYADFVNMYQDTRNGRGPEAARKAAVRQIKEAKGLSAIVGWDLIDEPGMELYTGVAGMKEIYDKLDPERLCVHNHFRMHVCLYYERFATVNWTDMYPAVHPGAEGPWAVAGWCRGIAQASSKPQWYWVLTAGAYETPEMYRLMAYLALQNDVKGIWHYNYCSDRHKSMADLVGNLLPIGKEVASLGERLLEVGPLLVPARVCWGQPLNVETSGGGEKPISATAMCDPAAKPGSAPVYMVIVNEDVAHPGRNMLSQKEQSGVATLPKSFVKPGRAVYDLYSLKQVAPSGSSKFQIETLRPGDGRIYMLGTSAQFGAAKKQIVINRVNEMLRVQGADREIGKNWGLWWAVEQFDKDAAEARQLASVGSFARAEEKAAEAGKRLLETMRKSERLRQTAESLASAKETLGQAIDFVFGPGHSYGYWDKPGSYRKPPYNYGFGEPTIKEEHVKSLEPLLRRYSQIRHDYLMGRCGGPELDFRAASVGLAESAQSLQADVRAYVDSIGAATSKHTP